MPKISFTLTDNTARDNLSISGKPAGVAIPWPLKSNATIDAGIYEVSTSNNEFVASLKTNALSATATKNNYLLDTLLNCGFRVLVAAYKSEATDFATAETEANTEIKTGNLYEDFKSRNTYDVQYLTTGIFANAISNGCAGALADVASSRLDTIALIDLSLTTTFAGITTAAANLPTANREFSACFFPACRFNVADLGESDTNIFPASFAYLKAFANSTSMFPDYFAVAGVARGAIPGLVEPICKLTDANAEAMYTDTYSINAIMPVAGYGTKIFGNRTLLPQAANTTKKYTNFLNVMILVADIMKQLQAAAVNCLFDPNDDTTWYKFTDAVDTLLDQMKANRGITTYRWVKTIARDKGVIEAKLYIRPIEAVEEFSIGVNLVDDDGIQTLEATLED